MHLSSPITMACVYNGGLNKYTMNDRSLRNLSLLLAQIVDQVLVHLKKIGLSVGQQQHYRLTREVSNDFLLDFEFGRSTPCGLHTHSFNCAKFAAAKAVLGRHQNYQLKVNKLK